MKPQNRHSSSGKVTVGNQTVWEMWAEKEKEKSSRAERLIAAGGFTASDLADKTGWSYYKAKGHLNRSGLRYMVANDHRARGTPVRFYFPPGVNPPS